MRPEVRRRVAGRKTYVATRFVLALVRLVCLIIADFLIAILPLISTMIMVIIVLMVLPVIVVVTMSVMLFATDPACRTLTGPTICGLRVAAAEGRVKRGRRNTLCPRRFGSFDWAGAASALRWAGATSAP